MGNITVTCNIQRNPVSQDIISYGYLEVKQGSTNKTVGSKRVWVTSDGPFNVTVVISYDDFANESSMTCVCLAAMETGDCTQVHKPFMLLQGMCYDMSHVLMWCGCHCLFNGVGRGLNKINVTKEPICYSMIYL